MTATALGRRGRGSWLVYTHFHDDCDACVDLCLCKVVNIWMFLDQRSLNVPQVSGWNPQVFFLTGGPRSRWCSLMIIYWLFLETMAVPQPVCAQLEASTWPLCSSLASLVQSTSVEAPCTGIRRCISCMGFSESEGVLDSNLWAQLIYQ